MGQMHRCFVKSELNLKKIITKYLQNKPNVIKVVEKVLSYSQKAVHTIHIYKWDENHTWNTNKLIYLVLI